MPAVSTGRRFKTAALKTNMALFFSGAVTSKSPSNQTAAFTRPERLSSGEVLTIRGEFPVVPQVTDRQRVTLLELDDLNQEAVCQIDLPRQSSGSRFSRTEVAGDSFVTPWWKNSDVTE